MVCKDYFGFSKQKYFPYFRKEVFKMSFKIAILVCLILMGLIAIITYYLGKKVSTNLFKYIPVFALGFGSIFFYTRLKFISYPNSFESIFDKVAIFLLLVVFTIALLEAIIIEIVANTELFRKGFLVMRKRLKL